MHPHSNSSTDRAHLLAHLDHVTETRQPLYITSADGEPEAVVVDAQTFTEMQEALELTRSLALCDKSMEYIESGAPGIGLEEGIQQIAKRLNLPSSQA